MANDKDFILKNAVEVSGPTKVTLGTVTSDNVDLSTGNYFKDTPSGNSTYSISNAGDVQSFQLEVTGGSEAVAENFSTTVYAGTGAVRSINNGIDLAGDGGMTWIKSRTSVNTAYIYDTERGATTSVTPSDTYAQESSGTTLTSFNSDGFSLSTANKVNGATNNYVSWSFKKAPKFFTCLTYTGDGIAGRTISHDLGTNVGMLVVKSTSTAGQWLVLHREMNTNPQNFYMALQTTSGTTSYGGLWNSTMPTSNAFTVGADANNNGTTYVAYLFAHDTAADSQIKCGSYTGTGSEQVIDLGWQAQWVMIKNASNSAGWYMVDLERGMTDTDGDGYLYANASSAEGNEATNLGVNAHSTDPTGFKVTSNGAQINVDGGDTYIYIAIRAASDPDITWPSSIEWAGGIAPSAPAVGETDVFTIATDDGGTTYTGVKTADNLS